MAQPLPCSSRRLPKHCCVLQKIISLSCPFFPAQLNLPAQAGLGADRGTETGPGGGTAHTRGLGKPRARHGAARCPLPPVARTDGRTGHPPFLRSSSSTTWMDSSGSFPGLRVKEALTEAGGGG